MKKTAIAVAVATAMGASGAASASTWELVSVVTKSSNGNAPLTLAGDLTFETDMSNNLVGNGAWTGQAFVGITPLFTHSWGAGMVFAGTVTGDFNCLEGAFGGVVGASICGNYNFGANFTNESTINTDGSNRVIGGDDMAIGPAQSIADFTGFVPNIPPSDFMTILEFENGGATDGQIWTFNLVPVPVPAAAWLFGSALGLLGWMRRRTSA